MTVEQRLANFASTTRLDALPGDVRERARSLFIDALACSFTGRAAESRETFAATARALGDGDGHVVVDDPRPAGLAASVLINAWQTTATTMCDVYRPAMCHVTPVTLAATLAHLASARSTDDLLLAFALGAEVTVRLCSAVDAMLYQGARWHAPGVIGPFGAATSAAVLRELDATELEHAWGLALMQSSGTFAAIGSPAVKFTQARAALAGVQAVEFTLAGHGGQDRALTHPDGGLFVAYDGARSDAAVHDLGIDWSLTGISLRRWPAASSLQSVVEAVLDLRAELSTVDAIEIALPPQSFKLCADKRWADQLTALQSARWVAAVVFMDGDCWLDQFAEARLSDARVAALAGRVTVIEDPDLPGGSAVVRVGGSERRVIVAPGSPERPLNANDVESKLLRAAGEHRGQAILDALASTDVAAFGAALVP